MPWLEHLKLQSVFHSDTLPPTGPYLLIVPLPMVLWSYGSTGAIFIQVTTVVRISFRHISRSGIAGLYSLDFSLGCCFDALLGFVGDRLFTFCWCFSAGFSHVLIVLSLSLSLWSFTLERSGWSLKLALNLLRAFSLPPCAGTTGLCHHTQLILVS